MKHVHIVGCSRSKAKGVGLVGRGDPAEKLYAGPLFKLLRQHLRQTKAEWYILSAMYGLVSPTRLVHTYDRTMKDLTRSERQDMAKLAALDLVDLSRPVRINWRKVSKRRSEIRPQELTVHLWCGKDYRDVIQHAKALQAFRMGRTTVTWVHEFEGTRGIGDQLGMVHDLVHAKPIEPINHHRPGEIKDQLSFHDLPGADRPNYDGQGKLF